MRRNHRDRQRSADVCGSAPTFLNQMEDKKFPGSGQHFLTHNFLSPLRAVCSFLKMRPRSVFRKTLFPFQKGAKGSSRRLGLGSQAS